MKKNTIFGIPGDKWRDKIRSIKSFSTLTHRTTTKQGRCVILPLHASLTVRRSSQLIAENSKSLSTHNKPPFLLGRNISSQVCWLSTSFTWNHTVTLLWTHPENIYICWYPHQRFSCNTSSRGQFVISQDNLICHSSNKHWKGVTSVGLKSVRCRLWHSLLLPLFNDWASVDAITNHKLL